MVSPIMRGISNVTPTLYWLTELNSISLIEDALEDVKPAVMPNLVLPIWAEAITAVAIARTAEMKIFFIEMEN